jgi:hypothetical protein
MTRTSIRSLDPVDPSAPPPDGTQLLQDVLATPRPSSRRRTGVRLAPAGLAIAVVAGLAAVAVWGGERGADEEEAVSGSRGAAIIHYVVRESLGAPDGSRQPVATHEHWQLQDGSRGRTVSRWVAPGPLEGTTSEDVVTRSQSLAYRPASEEQPATIIRYRPSDDYAAIPQQDPPTFAAPPIGGSPEVGDPRAVPDRLAVGDKEVSRLPDATMRGVAVEQFQVGECDKAASIPPAVTMPQRAIVALARDTLTPVRVTLEPCLQSVGSRVLDYLSFEELAPTPENRALLELSPHPGVPIVDGIDIDKAEERDEPAPMATPTPTGGARQG